MRLSPQAITIIKQLVEQVTGEAAEVKLFGSRLDDSKKGGDIDLLVTLNQSVENPALLTAQLVAKITQAMQGRKVDVLLTAPNLKKQDIHRIAEQQGELL